jgi:hypothetical protein
VRCGRTQTAKFDKWCGKNFDAVSSLIMALMHPVSNLRVDSQVAMIQLKELHSGFRVISRDRLLASRNNRPEMIFCVAMYIVEEIGSSRRRSIFQSYGLGDSLAEIQERASSLVIHQSRMIKHLNKE